MVRETTITECGISIVAKKNFLSRNSQFHSHSGLSLNHTPPLKMYAAVRLFASVGGSPKPFDEKLRSKEMARAKTPRTVKPKAEKKVLQMPDSINGNGSANHTAGDIESAIRLRAYELFEQRGYAHGLAEQDWLNAEREILARHSQAKQTA
jgi:Protein of unknown function (DUF2934)